MMNKPVTSPAQPSSPEVSKPWWRYPIVWMVVGGPLAVVVAGISTALIAYRNVDPVMDISQPTSQASHKPAMQGRNLAADHAMKSDDAP
jgi:uncharacterized protein